MDTPASPYRIRTWRVALCLLIVILLILVTLGYHDGAFGTQPLSSAHEDGDYRFRGIVDAVRPETEGEHGRIVLRDDSGRADLLWNATQPQVGLLYVVNAHMEKEQLFADALTPALVFEKPWT